MSGGGSTSGGSAAGGSSGGSVAGGSTAGGATGGGSSAGGSTGGGTSFDGGTPTIVVVGYGGRRARSVDGQTWQNFQQLTPNGGDDDNLFRGVGYGDGTFVAVGGSTHAYTMTSTDGITWANENRTPRAWLGNVAYLSGQFVAAGGNGLRVRSTDRGVTWTSDPGYQPIHYRDVASGNGIVIAVGHNYDTTPNVGIGAVTSNGTQWMETHRGGAAFADIEFGNGVFIATGGQRVARTTNGMTWTDVTFATTGATSVAFTDTEFIVGVGSSHYRSTDGMTWTPVTTSRDVDAYFAGRYLSLSWPAQIFASTSLSQWSSVFNPQGSGFTRFAVGVAR